MSKPYSNSKQLFFTLKTPRCSWESKWRLITHNVVLFTKIVTSTMLHSMTRRNYITYIAHTSIYFFNTHFFILFLGIRYILIFTFLTFGNFRDPYFRYKLIRYQFFVGSTWYKCFIK